MKTEYEKIYEKLYSFTGEKFCRSKKAQESFIFCGSGNWDYYCMDKGRNREFGEFENVELIGFNTAQELESYEIDRKKIIDFSREHVTEEGINRYFLLIQR